MAKKKKVPATPLTPQKTESQPVQATPQSPQKNTSCGQPSTQTPPAAPKP